MGGDEAVGPRTEETWDRVAKNMLRAELMRRGLSYAGLVEKLAAVGVQESEANLRNKVSRGRFTATFLLQCMTAVGVDWLRVPTMEELEVAAGEHGGQALAADRPRTEPPPRARRS